MHCNILTEQFLQGNVPLMLQLHKETLFIPCQRSAIKEVNHYSLYLWMSTFLKKLWPQFTSAAVSTYSQFKYYYVNTFITDTTVYTNYSSICFVFNVSCQSVDNVFSSLGGHWSVGMAKLVWFHTAVYCHVVLLWS